MIAVVTDSNSQIPPSLVERFGVTVVPLSVTVDGVTYLEGVDLEADDFFARFQAGRPAPAVTTASPSPGQFAAAYDRLVAHGADAIVSVHIGSAVSATVNSALLAAPGVPVPVRIVDTGTASFAVALCVWAAAEAIASGADLDEAATAARQTATRVGNVFVVQALDLARAGGRLAPDAVDEPDEPGSIPVLTMVEGAMHVVGHAVDIDAAANAMVAHVAAAASQDGIRAGVGFGDAAMAPLRDAVEAGVRALPNVREVVRYRVGPSVGVHTGPGTVGVMYG